MSIGITQTKTVRFVIDGEIVGTVDVDIPFDFTIDRTGEQEVRLLTPDTRETRRILTKAIQAFAETINNEF